jgi:hypothetical protein
VEGGGGEIKGGGERVLGAFVSEVENKMGKLKERERARKEEREREKEGEGEEERRR